MLRTVACTVLLTSATLSAIAPHLSFTTQIQQSAKVSATCAVAVFIGALAHSVLFHTKQTYASTVHKNIPHALDVIGLGTPFIYTYNAKQLPHILTNHDNSALLLGICADLGWIISKIIWESKA